MSIKTTAALTAMGLLAALGMAAPAQALPVSADVVVIMDESGSMGGEQAFIGGAMTTLDSELNTAGITGNRFGNVGFGASNPAPHQINVGGGQFGTSAEFDTSTGSYVTSGATEDGWAGIDFANGYSFRSGVARNFILVTDEDRDNTNAGLNYNGILNSLTSTGTLLNAVLNVSLKCGDGSTALGLDSKGNGYKADGAGGYTTCANAAAVSGSGSTIADYVNLALASGGAVWDLNILRLGGLNADSFTEAFIDIKVQEIQDQPVDVPEPAALGLFGLGLAGLGFATRRRK